MPEANNQFTGSKMNKDLSPRLIPSTQYIDARNATVLNSEGGESGLLQNVEGNTLLTNLNLTGDNLEIVGLFSDKILDRMFLFVTNWNDPSADGISNFASLDSSHYICMYDIKTSSPTTLVSGSFLNFSKTKHILAVNLLEDLLFFTDNRNQPRKINVNSAISNPTYYTNEDNISVLRYFPWNAPRLSQNILSPGETSKYPLEVRSEILVTTQPQIMSKPAGTYIEQVGSSGWTTSGDGVGAYISITLIENSSVPGGRSISSVFVSDFNLTGNITTNPTNKNPTTTTGVIQSGTSGAGVGLTVSITTTGAAGSATVTDVSITSAGTGYLSADTVTFPGTSFGGGVGGDLVITLATVTDLGGNNFGIGDTITIGDGWTGTSSSLANIVLTIGSQNIAQTPTMKDVVSDNLPGSVERGVTQVSSSLNFKYGSPVTRGSSVWSSFDEVTQTATADDTPRPILLTQYGDNSSLKVFDLQSGTSPVGLEGTELEITVNVETKGTFDVVTRGTGYVVSSSPATSNLATVFELPSTGVGLTVDILEVSTAQPGFAAGSIIRAIVTNPGSGYKVGDTALIDLPGGAPSARLAIISTTAYGTLITGDGTLDSSITTPTSGATPGTYTNATYTINPIIAPGPPLNLTQIDLIVTSPTEVQINVVNSSISDNALRWSAGDSITFAAGTIGSSSQPLVVTIQSTDIERDQFTVAVVNSGKNYAANQQIKIKKWSDDGPIPGLYADLYLTLTGDRLSLLPPGSFVGGILTSTDSNGAPKLLLSDNVKIEANINGDEITNTSGASVSTIPGDIVTLGANPLYDPTFDGDDDFLTEKFVRFSYRFKFDDNQYSLIAPFTQVAFIPRQDGYFLEDSIPENINDVESNSDENRAIKSTIIAFFENKVNQVGITIDMPEGVNTPAELYDKLKVVAIDILYKDADESDIKVIDTITKDSFIGLATNQYTYNYNSSMPIRTLRSVDFTRAADRAPVRAKAQEIAGNRVMYGNYLDRTARPDKLNYIATSGEKQSYGTYNSFNQVEYPNHNLKQNRLYEIGIVLADKFGRQSDVISSDNSTVFNNYRQEIGDIKPYLGDSLKIDWRGTIPSVIDKEGYAGLYSSTNPLGWYSYKVVVKQSAQDYYNVYLPTILNNRPQPDIVRINIATVINDDKEYGYFELTSDADPLPAMWVGATLQGTNSGITSDSVYITSLTSSGRVLYFHNTDTTIVESIGTGWANLKITSLDIETDEDSAFVTLFSDNINKVPRDLKTSASQDLTFSSSTKLYGRVWNYLYYDDSSSNMQYFPNPNGRADDVGRIGLIPDIGVNKDSKGNFAFVSPFYSVPLASVKGGNPYAASINTEKLIGATGGNSEPNVSFEKLRLNVYETTPFESNLDLYYESSSSGLISQLNNYISQDSDINQPSSITDWSWELNENNAPGVGGNVSWFDVVDGIGNSIINPLDTAPYIVTGEIIKVINASGSILSNTSYFTLEQNTTVPNTDADRYKFKIKTAAGRYFAYDSNSWQRNTYAFVIRFTNTLTNGEVFSNDITIIQPNELDNAVPSYASIPNPIPDAQEFYTNGYRTLYQLDGKNGSANTTDPSIFKRELLWTVTNVEFLWVGNGNTWTVYSPTIGGEEASLENNISWMLFTSTSGAISPETLSYSSEFVTLNVNAASLTSLYEYNNRVDTEFKVTLKLNDASGLNGSLSTTTTIYFTLLAP